MRLRTRSQGTAAALLALMLAVCAAPSHAQAPAARTPEGVWQGTLQGALRVVVKLQAGAEGSLRGTLDSPDQGATGLPIDEISTRGDSLFFHLNRVGGGFAGLMNAERTEIVGVWSQGGFSVPLTFGRVEKAPEVRRPQEPQPPYPYEAEEVSYENAKAGVRLAGTLTLPRTPGPHPCALLITGSGPEDRDEKIFGHRPFLVIADHLTRHGIAVLRVDDRGVGGSTGSTANATSEDFASDVLAGIDFLLARQDIDRGRIGLIGHSEGGLIAPMVAARSKHVAFVVLLAGPGLPGDRLLVLQSAALRRAAGVGEEQLARERPLLDSMYAAVRAGADSVAIAAIMSEVVTAQTGRAASDTATTALVRSQTRMLLSPWMQFFIRHDPRPTLGRVKCPVLAMNGERDLQVPAKENLGAIEEALRAGGNRDFTVKELPGLNHLFQSAETGGVWEYARIEETVSPLALEAMTAWIAQRGRAMR